MTTTTTPDLFPSPDERVVLDVVDTLTVAAHDDFIIGAFNEDYFARGEIIDVDVLDESDDPIEGPMGYYCVTPAAGTVTVSFTGDAILVETPHGTATFAGHSVLRLYGKNVDPKTPLNP